MLKTQLPKERIGDIEVTSEYWDCECEHYYIHPKTDACCEICLAIREECPDSRVDEVVAAGYSIPA